MSPLFCDRGGQTEDRGIGYSRKLDVNLLNRNWRGVASDTFIVWWRQFERVCKHLDWEAKAAGSTEGKLCNARKLSQTATSVLHWPHSGTENLFGESLPHLLHTEASSASVQRSSLTCCRVCCHSITASQHHSQHSWTRYQYHGGNCESAGNCFL